MNRLHPAVALVAALLAALLLLRAVRADSAPGAALALPAFSAAPSTTPRDPATPRSTPSLSATARPHPPSLADLRAALAVLDSTRAAAFTDPPNADPDLWAARSCACHADDVGRLRALARDGTGLRGQRTLVASMALARPATPNRADLLVTDRTTAYSAVDASGRAVRRWPASGPRRWRITLVRASGRWLLGTIARAP